LTVSDKQTIRKKLNINHKNTHINTIQIKEKQKQNYPDSVASYNAQPGNEVGLFYNGREHHTGEVYSDWEAVNRPAGCSRSLGQ